jgi:hypothetical protein
MKKLMVEEVDSTESGLIFQLIELIKGGYTYSAKKLRFP